MTIPTGNQTFLQYGEYPYSYINGLAISNNATTPNTLLDVAAGVTIDSTNTFQMISQDSMTINAANTGLNGIDTGTFAASKVYAVFLISDPVTTNPTGCMISLSYTQPLMPFGYGAFRLIGYVATDASAHFLKGYWTNDSSSSRLFLFDAPQATAITAGNATSYTNVDLTGLVPLINNLPVYIASAFTPGAASRVLNLTPGNGVGNAVTITGQVTSVVVSTNSLVLAQTVAISSVNSPTIDYKVSNSGDAVAINVAGYQFTL